MTGFIESWISMRTERNEPTKTSTKQSYGLPDGHDNPEHWAYVPEDLREEYIAQCADPDAEGDRELRAIRQAGSGPVLRSWPMRKPPHAQGLMNSYLKADYLNLDQPHDREIYLHLERLDDIKRAREDHEAKLRTEAKLHAFRTGATCEACNVVQPSTVKTVAVGGHQFQLCDDCSTIAIADAVERSANEMIPDLGVTRRDAVNRMREQRIHLQNGARAS